MASAKGRFVAAEVPSTAHGLVRAGLREGLCLPPVEVSDTHGPYAALRRCCAWGPRDRAVAIVSVEAYREGRRMSAVSWEQGLELLKQGKAQEAEQVLRQVTGVDALSFEGNFYLGTALAQQGRYQEAVTPFSTAVNIDPNHAGAHYNLGLALQHAGDAHRAMGELEAALAIKPDYAKASQALQALKSQQAAQGRPRPVMPQAVSPGQWESRQADEPVYSEEQLREADRAEKIQQFFVRGACMVAWGIGLTALFITFCNVMGPFFGIIIIVPILGPLVYLVAMDSREWFVVNPKLAIPVSIVGILFSIGAVIWSIAREGFTSG